MFLIFVRFLLFLILTVLLILSLLIIFLRLLVSKFLPFDIVFLGLSSLPTETSSLNFEFPGFKGLIIVVYSVTLGIGIGEEVIYSS